MRVLDAQGNPEQKETKQGVQTVDAMPTLMKVDVSVHCQVLWLKC